jgi:two-component system, cell cycle sensor histidine kinase DivJ
MHNQHHRGRSGLVRCEKRVFDRETVHGLAAYFSSLVHESVRGNSLAAARQQTFIASHVLSGLLALCVFPIYLVVSGKPSPASAVAFLWLLTPIAVAIFLSRTGRLAAAQLPSAVNFAALVTYCCWLTGGLGSWLIPWMVAVPLQAGLSGDRRIIAFATGAAGLGLAILGTAAWVGYAQPVEPEPLSPVVLGFIGAMTATAYAAALAMTVQLLPKRSENAVLPGDEFYRRLVDNVSDMITRHDEKGRVLFASLGAKQLLGEPTQKALGDGLFERVHVADRPAYLTALSGCLANNEPTAVEFRVRHAGGVEAARYLWAEMDCRPMRGADGAGLERLSIVAVTRDISDRKTQEAELVRTRDEAESANRIKTQFLANMSHELRTPLNSIMGFSEILNRELFGSLGEGRYRDYAHLIHESGEHLLNVVNDILDISKIETGKFKILKEPVDVSTLVKSCCDVMRHTAEQKQLALMLEVAPCLPALSADNRACKQMLLNVISNAIKFTNPGGSVCVSARASNGAVELAVTDNGVGIAAAELPKLGNPFVQASNSHDGSCEGAGLGLSVVKGLARLHGGKLELKSTLGKGTTATITLPLNSHSESVEASPKTPTVSAA